MKREIPLEAKRACVDKVLDSVVFARAGQLRRLLRWLADRAFSGGPVPTEHEVAQKALGRPEAFDPQTDSLVRKEMSRLRVKLREYYAGPGRAEVIRVRSDDGYRLSFEMVRAGSDPDLPGTGQPCLLVLPLSASQAVQDFADAFYDDLLSRFAEMDSLELVARTTARMYGDRSGDVRDFALETGADYLIEGTARVKGDLTEVILWLADGRTGRSRLLSRALGTGSEELSESVAKNILDKLAAMK